MDKRKFNKGTVGNKGGGRKSEVYKKNLAKAIEMIISTDEIIFQMANIVMDSNSSAADKIKASTFLLEQQHQIQNQNKIKKFEAFNLKYVINTVQTQQHQKVENFVLIWPKLKNYIEKKISFQWEVNQSIKVGDHQVVLTPIPFGCIKAEEIVTINGYVKPLEIKQVEILQILNQIYQQTKHEKTDSIL
mgnify:CR=1 FL=1